MKLRKTLLLKQSLLSIFLFISLIFIFIFGEIKREGILIYFIFILNMLISSYYLFNMDEYDYSFNKIFWIFNLIFLSFLPFLQFIFDLQVWVDLSGHFDSEDFIHANVLILFWMISYILGYKTKIIKFRMVRKSLLEFNRFKIVGVFICSIIFITAANFFIIENTIELIQTVRLLLKNSLEGLMMFSIALLVHQYTFIKNIVYLFFIVGLISFYFIFGVHWGGGGRHLLGVIVFGLYFTYSRYFSDVYFIALMFLALMIFPFLGQVRLDKGLSDISFTVSPLDIIRSGDFDAYSMLINIIKYVNEHGIEYGQQLFGVLFFFVPRSVWESKPIGSGAHVAEHYNYGFTNLSAPLVSEFYINFHVLGIIFFGFWVGGLLKLIDRKYWYYVTVNHQRYLFFIYPFLMMYFFFMLRGDLLSSFAFIFGFVISTYIFFRCIKTNHN